MPEKFFNLLPELTVALGQTLVRLDIRPYQAAREKSEAAIRAAEADIARGEASASAIVIVKPSGEKSVIYQPMETAPLDRQALTLAMAVSRVLRNAL